MSLETLLALPRWVYLGVFAGAMMSAGVAAVFLLAPRVFPEEDRSASARHTAEDRRRAEIRAYLEDIDERFVEDAPLGGRTVAFHLPEREVAVTFDVRTFYALEETPTHAILAEHEMPGGALGNRLPFETPEAAAVGRPSGEADAAIEEAYAVLGLPAGADETAARRAYRERVKEVHPDHGGDEADFQRVRNAYETVRKHTP